MRTIERIGQNRFGAGMSYTFLVFPSGRIYEGVSVGRISYHSGGSSDGKARNTLGAAICLAGNYEANDLGDRAIQAIVWLLQEGVRRKWWGDPALTEGHRDFKSTSCPGKYAYADLGRINSLGRGQATEAPTILPAATTPKPKPKPTRVQENSENTPASNANIARTLNAMGYKAGAPDGVPGPYLRDGVKAYQAAQVYFPGMKADGNWGPMTQAHFDWVRGTLQPAVAKWKASKRLGALVQDGDYAAVTKRHVTEVQEDNYPAYRRVGGYYKDGLAGPVTCKLLGIKPHPSA